MLGDDPLAVVQPALERRPEYYALPRLVAFDPIPPGLLARRIAFCVQRREVGRHLGEVDELQTERFGHELVSARDREPGFADLDVERHEPEFLAVPPGLALLAPAIGFPVHHDGRVAHRTEGRRQGLGIKQRGEALMLLAAGGETHFGAVPGDVRRGAVDFLQGVDLAEQEDVLCLRPVQVGDVQVAHCLLVPSGPDQG